MFLTSMHLHIAGSVWCDPCALHATLSCILFYWTPYE